MTNVNEVINRDATENLAEVFKVDEGKGMKIVDIIISSAKRILFNAEADRDAAISNLSIVIDLTESLNEAIGPMTDNEIAYSFYQIGYYERQIVSYLTPTDAN